MARKEESESRKKKSEGVFSELKDETLQGIVAILFFAVGILFTLSAFGKAGVVGEAIHQWLSKLLGYGFTLLPIACIMMGISFWRSMKRRFPATRIVGIGIFFFSGLAIVDIIAPLRGGVIGGFVATPLVKLFDVYTSLVILGALFIISLIIIFDTRPAFEPMLSYFKKLLGGQNNDSSPKIYGAVEGDRQLDGGESASEAKHGQNGEANENANTTRSEGNISQNENQKKKGVENEKNSIGIKDEIRIPSFFPRTVYRPPPLSLLEYDRGRPGVGDIKANANIIKRTLQNFGINVEMDEVSIGPSVTRYALKPAEGVKLSKIVALQNDLSLALAAHPIRIEAPIPGKSLVGIEIPNSTKSVVGLATLLGNEEYVRSEKPLLIALGKNVTGQSRFANLSKMPHLLIAGTTGSGKSVTIHTLINSLLFRNPPENLRLIMIDPKRVELTLYNKTPHLLTPVITEAKKAILALKWAAKEMDRRYDILESESVRDIESYHKNILLPELKKLEKLPAEDKEVSGKIPEPMPYIVIVIDELADIMSTYPRELESAIVRLAQMSRAVGIHLILSTQRPSVNVITGLIKANIPGRIALQVSSQIDSRTILDTGGAEKLLGAGDMLFLGGEMSKPERLQSAFISETEVKKVVRHFAEAYKDELPSELTLTPETVASPNAIFESSFEEEDGDIDDDLYESARVEVVQAGKASTSYIQRKLRVGYARAARIMDKLHERGVIGPADGSKPREIIGSVPKENVEESSETL